MGNTVLYHHLNLSLIMISVNYSMDRTGGWQGWIGIKVIVQYLLCRGNKSKLTNFQNPSFLLFAIFFNTPEHYVIEINSLN